MKSFSHKSTGGRQKLTGKALPKNGQIFCYVCLYVCMCLFDCSHIVQHAASKHCFKALSEARSNFVLKGFPIGFEMAEKNERRQTFSYSYK